VPLFIKSLNDNNPSVRANAILGLGKFGVEAKLAIPALVQRSKDPDDRIKSLTKFALAQIDAAASDPASGK
jgi:HEAT repeat protein